MDKLELKHIAPYLPYGLKLWDAEDKKTIDLISLHTSEEDGDQMEFYAVAEEPSSDWLDLDHPYVKPLLLPLSALKPENVNMGEIQFELFIRKVKDQKSKYCNMVLLFKNHYDVFGLIDAGLALNKNDYIK